MLGWLNCTVFLLFTTQAMVDTADTEAPGPGGHATEATEAMEAMEATGVNAKADSPNSFIV